MTQCSAQTYRYENGVQTAVFCDQVAIVQTRALDGSRNYGCAEHAAAMIEAGAVKVRDLEG